MRSPIQTQSSRTVVPLAAAFSALLATSAFAQDNPEDGNARQLEEVMVTARKQTESLQDAPISISAFSGQGLEDRGALKLIEIENFTPNLTFQNNPSFGGASSAAAIYIRGIGQKEFLPTVDPGVGLYVDGIYIARSVGAILDLVEIEQVEVLRGPQGTLFGRNSIGGAINITTKKPDDQLYGKFEGTLGTDQLQNFKAVANVPLADNFFSRFSIASMQQDGYVDRPYDGKDLGDDDTVSARAAFRWDASDGLEVNLSLDYTKDRENGPAITLLGINYGDPVDPQTPPMATIHNVGANIAAGGPPIPCIIPPLTGTINTAVPGCYDNRYVVGDHLNMGTAPSFSETDLFATALTLNWMLSDELEFRSLTGYRDLESDFGRDGDGSPFRVSQFLDALQQTQFTQEFQLLGNSMDHRLNWILGAYYFKEDGDNKNTLDFTVSNFVSGGAFDNKSLALFAQAGFDLTDRLTFTAGLRYTDETKKFLPDQYIIQNYFAGSGHPQLDAPFMQAGSRVLPLVEKTESYTETTPMLNLRWQTSDDLMLYATYAEGFKSGGFSQRVFPPQVAGFTAPAGTPDVDLIPSFKPEFVDSYEAGFKFSNADNTLRLNGAAFFTNYDDFQIQVFTSVAPVTKNAAEVEIKGGELELLWLPADNWQLEAGVGVVDAKYSKIDSSQTLVDKSNELERVPDLTVNAAISRDLNFADKGTGMVRLDWSYRSDFYMDTFNTELIHQEAYGLLNASVSWRSPSERYQLILGGKNLTDERYMISGIIGDAFQSYEAVYSRGREYYLTFRCHFGTI